MRPSRRPLSPTPVFNLKLRSLAFPRLPFSEAELQRYIDQEAGSFRDKFERQFRCTLAEDHPATPFCRPLPLASPASAVFYHALALISNGSCSWRTPVCTRPGVSCRLPSPRWRPS